MSTAWRSEGDVEQKLLQPLFHDVLGYPDDDLSWKFPVRIDLGRERRVKQADLVVNCIAYAAGDTGGWWWPIDGIDGVVWPPGIAMETTLECFAALYESLGYERCVGAHLEDGFEKVAIYVDGDEIPTHAARQLPSGAWTSKLGELADIEHESLSNLEDSSGTGLAYGKVALVMRRRSSPTTKP